MMKYLQVYLRFVQSWYQIIFGQKSEISMVVIMSKFNDRLLTLYNNKKNISKPPSYMEDL